MSTLHELMGFGQIVYSDGAGSVVDTDPYAPDEGVRYVESAIHIHRHADDGATDGDIDLASAGLEEWELLRGFTGQYGHNSPVMHDSEYIGGKLERFIRENAGYYVAVVLVERSTTETAPVGWAVATRHTLLDLAMGGAP